MGGSVAEDLYRAGRQQEIYMRQHGWPYQTRQGETCFWVAMQYGVCIELLPMCRIVNVDIDNINCDTKKTTCMILRNCSYAYGSPAQFYMAYKNKLFTTYDILAASDLLAAIIDPSGCHWNRSSLESSAVVMCCMVVLGDTLSDYVGKPYSALGDAIQQTLGIH